MIAMMTDAGFQALATIITVIVTGVIGTAFTVYRENRNRKWLLEDQARKDAIAKAEREEASMKFNQTAKQIAADVHTDHEELKATVKTEAGYARDRSYKIQDAVKEAHTAATSAFEEANHANRKITDVKSEISNLNSRLLEVQIPSIAPVETDTEAKPKA